MLFIKKTRKASTIVIDIYVKFENIEQLYIVLTLIFINTDTI